MGARKAGNENVHADRDQIDAMTRHAAIHGAELVILPPELDVSGGLTLEKRPSLLAAIEGVERGEYDAVIVAYLSRLGRNVREQLRAWDRVEAAGGSIISVQDGIDTRTPAGRMHRTVMLAVAEMEREQHVERFANLREWATMAGVWQRRQVPTGYAKDPATRKLIPSHDAAKVRQAFIDRIGGKALVSVARDLQMTPSGARGVLRNRVYLGELRVGPHVNPAAHPAIVDEETWLAAQDARITRPARNNPAPALLGGLVRCAGCLHVMSRTAANVTVYVCHANHSAGRCPAPAGITLRLLDEHVEQIALARLRKMWAQGDRTDAPLRKARAALKDAEAELAAFLEGVAAAGLAAAQFVSAARDRRKAVENARRALQRVLAGRLPTTGHKTPEEFWAALSVEKRNHHLGRLIEAVVVERSGGRGRIRPIEDRVRVIAYGAGMVDTARFRGRARPNVTLPLPEPDGPHILRVDLGVGEF